MVIVDVTFDAVQTSPKDMLLKPELKFKWFGYVCVIELGNELVDADVTSLVQRLDQCGVASHLIKGQKCASFYPIFHYGQCGDIDLFVGEELYTRAKELIRSKGIEIEKKEDVHDVHFI
ncbi:nucleotidyltransferase family protein [Bacteroides ovatus]|uniref:nucleotidyltransferase family protein n=1 Tax=Bacteroides ovatus TaxID=28116 RepID=UPI0012AB7E44|nr:nucleotidyltransferase family protein [Bacteroides ovatus]